MKSRAIVCCCAALGFWFVDRAAWAQGGVNFSNFGTGWVEPWYGLGSTNTVRLFFPEMCFGVGEIPVNTGLLAGTGFTAELWGGPEGSQANLQFLSRTTFRTGTAAGLLLPQNPVAVPFAVPGQRVALQLRVYDNRGGTFTSWAQVQSCFCTMAGMSKVFTSEPLGDTPVTLRGMGSYCLTADSITLPVPLLSLDTGGSIHIWGAPTRIKFYEPSLSGRRSLVAGDTATLTVDVPNPGSSIAWSYNDVDLPGQTAQSLVLSNIQPGQSGFYSARVRVNIGSLVFSGGTSMHLAVTPRPLLEDAARDISGTFTARIRGITNRSVAIESSTDLQNWVRGPTNWVGGQNFCTGNTVTNPPLFGPQLFYRAVVLP